MPLLSDVLPTIFLHINVHIACWKFYPSVETYQSSLKSCPIVFHMFCVSVKVLTKGRRDDYPLFSQTFLFVYHRSRQWKSFVSWGAIVNRRYYFVRKLFPVSMNFSIESKIVISRTTSNILLSFFSTVCLSICLRNHVCSKNSNSIVYHILCVLPLQSCKYRRGCVLNLYSQKWRSQRQFSLKIITEPILSFRHSIDIHV